MKILFVCYINKVRSRTAETLYNGYGQIQAKSAGIAHDAMVPITPDLIGWADLIVVMEYEMEDFIREKFSGLVGHRQIINLEIYDNFYYMQPELVRLIRDKVDPLLKKD